MTLEIYRAIPETDRFGLSAIDAPEERTFDAFGVCAVSEERDKPRLLSLAIALLIWIAVFGLLNLVLPPVVELP